MVSGLIEWCTKYCCLWGHRRGAVNSLQRRLKMKVKFELDIPSRGMHFIRVVRAFALLPDKCSLKLLLYLLLIW